MKFGRDDYDNQKALDSVPQDEPVFLLRAQDEAAIEAVRNYAHRLRVLGAPSEVYESAWSQADRMEEWCQRKPVDLSQNARMSLEAEDGENTDNFLDMG